MQCPAKVVSYADFIQKDTAVKWAAIYNSYVNLTPVNPSFSIRDFYLEKLKKGKVKAYVEVDSTLKAKVVNITHADVIKNLKYIPPAYEAMMNWMFGYDGKPDSSESIFLNDLNLCDTCLERNKLEFFKVKQLFYYRNNQFYIKNILFAPVIYTRNEAMQTRGLRFAEVANIGFDNRPGVIKIPSSAIYIGRACNNIQLSLMNDILHGCKLLTDSSPDLSPILLTDAKCGRIKFYDTEKSIYQDSKFVIDKDSIESFRQKFVEVMLYDSTGQAVDNRKIKIDIDIYSMDNYKLVQDFYFDFKNERLYSKLVSLVFYKRKYPEFDSRENYWGVMFSD
ncbi:MAG: hypothetical protein IPP72_00240 [Chitinophagaceae bacterium]|nr:hypothetical protein [Chitinophagaceae bacterium]